MEATMALKSKETTTEVTTITGSNTSMTENLKLDFQNIIMG